MCGIIGIVGDAQTNVSPLLIEGLRRLEYRGYDSAGIATLSSKGELHCRRREGKLISLEQEIENNPISGNAGIGHTRWATHGRPTAINAHPHHTEKVAVVHNGIIENFRELRGELEADGYLMKSDTDTEVVPHLITRFLSQGIGPEAAVMATLQRLRGTFALAILFAGERPFLMVARRGSPLAIGHGEEKMFAGSDAIALAPFTSRITFLEDGDVALISKTELSVWDGSGNKVERPIRQSTAKNAVADKGGYRHFMLKEICEQPNVLAETLAHYIDPASKEIGLPTLPFDPAKLADLSIVACGTSYYAGMTAKYWLEKYAGLPVNLDIASEYRYRDTPLSRNGAALFISQSGETADTLAALKMVRDQKQHILSVVNVQESSMAMASDAVLPTLAGAEIGVASTKAFTAQLAALACLTLGFADARKTLQPEDRAQLIYGLAQLPELASAVLGKEDELGKLAHEVMHAPDVFFIGRGTAYPVALEGALKFKELTYIHAEGIAAGELKHGPLALISDNVPVIAIVPTDSLFEKTCSNIQEVSARGGKVIAFCDAEGAAVLKKTAAHIVVLPKCRAFLQPVVYAIALQLLAYHAALAMGNDVDQPRNLAKSVTVE